MDRHAVRRAIPALYLVAVVLTLVLAGTGGAFVATLILGAMLMAVAFSLTAPRRPAPTASRAADRSAARQARRQRRPG